MTQAALDLEGPKPEWNGQLSHLLPVLTRETMAKPGRWAYRQLKQGALVAVLIGPERRRILRIARAEAPANDRARDRWAAELVTFHKHLGTGHWQRLPDEDVKGVAVRYLELYEGEVEPGKAQCGACKQPIPFDPIWGKAQRCDHCARVAGEDEARAMREGRVDGRE